MKEFKLLPKIYNWQLWRNKIAPAGGYTPPYKVYTALLTQTGTDAPVATVLENTLGETLTPGYTTNGVFYLDAISPIFTSDKTFLYIQTGKSGSLYMSNIYRTNDYRITFKTWIYSGGLGIGINNVLLNNVIEIRVYN